MPSLKELRSRISSVKATRKITKAMQMVAAAKLRRAQLQAESARPYADYIDSMLREVASMPQSESHPLLLGRLPLRDSVTKTAHLLVVCTGDRGLCGSFNSSIIRTARDYILQLQANNCNIRLLCIGRKGADALRRIFPSISLETISPRNKRTITFDDALSIYDAIMNLFNSEQADTVTIFYSQFISMIKQAPVSRRLIPYLNTNTTFNENISSTDAETIHDDTHTEPDLADSNLRRVTPDVDTVVKELLLHNLSAQIFKALLENNASFYSAQITAMDNATRNAEDMVRKMSIDYNRSRQAIITKELIEVISGAEAAVR